MCSAVVLHVFPTLKSISGAENALLRQIESDSYNSHHIICAQNLPREIRDHMTALGATAHALGRLSGWGLLTTVIHLQRLYRDLRPDVIVGWMYIGAIFAAMAAILTLRHPPLIWSLHHSFDEIALVKKTTRWSIKVCRLLVFVPTKIIYVSQFSRICHEKIGFPAQKSQVIYNPIPDLPMTPISTRTNDLRIGMASRWDATKDFTTLFAAVAGLQKAGYPVVLHLCGPNIDPQNTALIGLLRNFQLVPGDNVILHGKLASIAPFFAKLDVYVQSSHREAFGMSAAEAMSAGIPLLVSKIGGLPEVVGDTRCVYRPGDVVDLIRKLIWVMDPAQRATLSAQGHQRHESLFRDKQIAQDNKALIKLLVKAQT